MDRVKFLEVKYTILYDCCEEDHYKIVPEALTQKCKTANHYYEMSD